MGLAQRGFSCELYERRPDPRTGKVERGRSINLPLSTRGIHALTQIGLADQVLAHAIPMRGRMVHATDQSVQLQPYGYSDSDAINSVSRADLNLILLEAAEKLGVKVRFGERITDFSQFEYVFGTDGSASKLRDDLEEEKV